jgi:hypothetical protein
MCDDDATENHQNANVLWGADKIKLFVTTILNVDLVG